MAEHVLACHRGMKDKREMANRTAIHVENECMDVKTPWTSLAHRLLVPANQARQSLQYRWSRCYRPL
jgi:hypothetical protein